MKTKDFLIVIAPPLLVFLAVFLFDLRINYLESLLLVFALPSIYLSLKSRAKVRKVLYFSLLVSIPIAFIFELVAVGDNAWIVPSSVFPFRLFGFIPIEDLLWQFLTVYTILIFYEHFCNRHFLPDISKRISLMLWLLYPAMFAVIAVFLVNSTPLQIPYSFLLLGLIFFSLPVILFLATYRGFFFGFLKTQLFFLYIHLIFELVGLKLGHWTFPGTHYIGWVNVLGQSFPVEEFIFVMLIGGFAACAYYEFFTNSRLRTAHARSKRLI